MSTWIPSAARHGLAVAALACGASSFALWAQPAIPAEYHTGGFAMGCQAYTFNRFTVFEAIEKTAQAGGKVIEFYPGQKLSKEQPTVTWDHNASGETVAAVQAKLAQHRVKAVNYGVVSIPVDEASARKVFAFAKKLGIRAITTESTDAIDTIEKLVKEYDVAVAYHNHPRQPKNPNYRVWDPHYIMALVEGRDARIGACADTGHWCTSGLNPVYCLQVLKGRIVSAHLKDKNAYGRGHDVPFGEGVADIKACLDELKAQGFTGNISIEYERNWENNVPEVTQCIDFVRKYGSPTR
ncbi:MAG: sugar phosphate isomerase/epimerase [Verrucomicrobia bacterium]|nr:sugar phosphate isomerase/epimerase [Verrucomicrobiota bacterium]